MKKYLIVFVILFSCISFAQVSKTAYQDEDGNWKYVKPSTPLPITSFDYFLSTPDTLGYGDSLGIAYLTGYFKGRLAIRDTLVGASAAELKDSVLFEAKDTVYNVWKGIAVKDIQTGDTIDAGTVVSPGNGVWWYELYDYPGTVRIRKINNVNGLNGLTGKTPIYFWAN
jgi:hypothetical protein